MSDASEQGAWDAAAGYLAQLLDPATVGSALEQAERQWVGFLVSGSAQPDLPEPVITLAHQVSLLTARAPVRLSSWSPELLGRLQDLASAIDLAARFNTDRTEELLRLAAHLYAVSLQPTRAVQVTRRLRDATPEGRVERDLLRSLVSSYRLGGRTTVDEVLGRLSEQFGTTAAMDDVLEAVATLGQPHAFRITREIESSLRERAAHDVRAAVGEVVSNEYLDVSYNSSQRWRQRTELLPPQYGVVHDGFLQESDALITTPTGTGKTYLAELRIAELLSRDPDALAVYVAPLNALARQVWRNLSARLSAFGEVTLWTGAYEIDSTSPVGRVLVMTPEKLDAVIRLALTEDERALDVIKRISLLVADEIHHVSSGARGITYEFLITRLRLLKSDLNVVGLSAVQPELTPMARWLAGRTREVAHTYSIEWESSEVRDLLWVKQGDVVMRSDYFNATHLARPAKVKEASALMAATLLARCESVLLVETRRDWAESLAKELFANYSEYLERRSAANGADSEAALARIEAGVQEVGAFLYPEHPLIPYLRVGLAFHHAGLPPQVRRTVEDLARRQIVHTVVSTTTLAEGVDLPFRAVVLCRLALPYGEPLRRARIRNIRGRAARPRYSSDGVFVVIEPEKTNTDAYQHFLDHYWEGTVDAVEAQSGLIDLFAVDRLRQASARRSLQRQLLALYSEQPYELDDIAEVARATLLEIASGPDSSVSRALRDAIRSETTAMLEAPAMLKVASPISVTPFGRAAVLGGLSADSALLVRGRLTQEVDRLAELTAADAATAAIRAAYLPWEAVEASEKYREVMMRRSGPGFVRDSQVADVLDDSRLRDDYRRAELLLSPRTLQEIATEFSEDRAIKGSSVNDRIAALVEWAGRVGGVLPWTLSGVLRVGEALQDDEPMLAPLMEAWLPFVGYLSSWIASPAIGDLGRRGLVDRDTAIQLLRAANLWHGTAEDFVEWLWVNQEEAAELVGRRQVSRLLDGVPDLDDDDEE